MCVRSHLSPRRILKVALNILELSVAPSLFPPTVSAEPRLHMHAPRLARAQHLECLLFPRPSSYLSSHTQSDAAQAIVDAMRGREIEAAFGAAVGFQYDNALFGQLFHVRTEAVAGVAALLSSSFVYIIF